MVNSDELLFVVNKFDVPQKPHPRHKVFKNGLWRRTVHVWIINEEKKFLCQKRSLKKDISPGKWEPAILGHMGPTDNYFSGAVREVYEETGIVVSPHNLKLLKIYRDEERKEYRAIFYCKLSLDVDNIKMEEDEVEDIQLIHFKKLKRHLLEEKSESWIYHGYEQELFDTIDSNESAR